jgi:dihydrofolate reductase
MHIWTYPLTLGTGKKLFAAGTQPERFKMVESKTTSTGVLFATYELSTSLKAESV